MEPTIDILLKAMKKLKEIIKTSARWLGYDIRRTVNNTIPVEFSKDEVELYEYVYGNQLTMVSAENLFTTMMACKHVIERSIEGDFVECGVWRGGNAIAAAGLFKLHGVDKKIYLFDTFEGMTEPTSDDVAFSGAVDAFDTYARNRKAGHNEWCLASLDDVRGNFRSANLLDEKVKFVQGDVSLTLADAANLPANIAVLRLDTDWYESTKIELDVLYPRLSQSGVLIVDDYGHWQGAKKAVDEYFDQHGKKPFLQYMTYSSRVGVKT